MCLRTSYSSATLKVFISTLMRRRCPLHQETKLLDVWKTERKLLSDISASKGNFWFWQLQNVNSVLYPHHNLLSSLHPHHSTIKIVLTLWLMRRAAVSLSALEPWAYPTRMSRNLTRWQAFWRNKHPASDSVLIRRRLLTGAQRRDQFKTFGLVFTPVYQPDCSSEPRRRPSLSGVYVR